jgi:hypothetical protein
MTMTNTALLPDASTAPLEFALLTLNLVDEEAFKLDDVTDTDASVLESGFCLTFDLGQQLEFSLSYDEESRHYTGAVCDTDPLEQAQMALLALQLNHHMPQERRFSIDPLNQRLTLNEIWSCEGLEMVNLATGLRNLIDAMMLFLSPSMSSETPQATTQTQPMLRV